VLLPDNIHPEHSVYYNGSFVLKVIQQVRRATLLDLYLETRHLHEMSMPLFVLCVDWLFLLGLVTLNDHGVIEICF